MRDEGLKEPVEVSLASTSDYRSAFNRRTARGWEAESHVSRCPGVQAFYSAQSVVQKDAGDL